MGEVSPKQGSEGKACQKTELSQTQKQTGVEAHSKPKATAPKSAKPRVCSRSQSRSCSGQFRRQPWALSSDSEVASDDSTGSTSHPGCWQIPITVEGVNTLVLIDTGASVTMMGTAILPKSAAGPHPEVTDTRYAMSRRYGWQPCPYVRLCRSRGRDCCRSTRHQWWLVPGKKAQFYY